MTVRQKKPSTPNNKLAKLGDAIAISKSETLNHCRCWEMLSHLKTKYTKQNTKYMNLYSKILIYTVLLRGNFCREFTHFCGVFFTGPKNMVAYQKLQISGMGPQDIVNCSGPLNIFVLKKNKFWHQRHTEALHCLGFGNDYDS